METISCAYSAWLAGEIYVDRRGYYRWRDTGRISSLSKIIRRHFADVSSFHRMACSWAALARAVQAKASA